MTAPPYRRRSAWCWAACRTPSPWSLPAATTRPWPRRDKARPDLIIVDIGLGNRTGYELCSAIKADGSLRGVPVYILASGQTPYDDARGRQAGADGHLVKPFESQSLIDRIHEALSRPASPPVASARPESVAPPVAPRPVRPLPARWSPPPRRPTSTTNTASSPSSAPRAGRRCPSVSGPGPPRRPGGSLVLGVPAPAAARGRPGRGAGPCLRPPPRPRRRLPLRPRPLRRCRRFERGTAPVADPGGPSGLAPRAPVSGCRPRRCARRRPRPRPVVPPALPKRTEVIADPAFHPRRPEPMAEAGMAATSAAHPGIGRTIMGLPAVAIPGVPAPRRARRSGRASDCTRDGPHGGPVGAPAPARRAGGDAGGARCGRSPSRRRAAAFRPPAAGPAPGLPSRRCAAWRPATPPRRSRRASIRRSPPSPRADPNTRPSPSCRARSSSRWCGRSFRSSRR